MVHSTSTAGLLVRVIVAFALTYALGYERELRGSPAGDRTFSLIGTASAVLGNLASAGSPNAIAGAVTGIGFIGGGIVVRRAIRTGEIISGITTAASIFAAAAIGAGAGAGLLAEAALATGLVLITLEGPHLPLLRLVDARRWSPRFSNDEDLPRDDDTTVLPDAAPSGEDRQRALRGLPRELPIFLACAATVIRQRRGPRWLAAIAPGNAATGVITCAVTAARGGLAKAGLPDRGR